MSKRDKDINGFITIKDNPITKVGVFPYLGREIGAPDPDKVYQVYRPEEELINPVTLQSANLVPWIDEHEFLGEDGTPAEEKGVQGTTGENAYFEYPYLKNNIRVYSEYLKGQIDRGKIELSPSYRCQYDFTPGEFEGKRYDAIQRDIRFNHLALVQEGRTGKDVAVLDHSITKDHFVITIDTSELIRKQKEQVMPFTEEQLVALEQLIQKVLAAQNPVVDKEPEEQKDELIEQPQDNPTAEQAVEVAEVAVEEAKLATETAQEAIEAVKEELTADSIRKEVVNQLNERDALAKRLTKYIGVFDSASFGSAQDVALYGIKKLGIKSGKGAEIATLDGYLQNTKAPIDTIAKDSKPVTGNDTINAVWKGKA